MPRKETIVEMEKSIDKGKRQIAKWDQKIMAQERLLKADANLAAAYSRKARTHRLCKRGAMLEKFLPSPDQLTDDQVMALLQIAFGQKQTQDALLAELDHAKTVQDTPEQKSDRTIIHRPGEIAPSGGFAVWPGGQFRKCTKAGTARPAVPAFVFKGLRPLAPLRSYLHQEKERTRKKVIPNCPVPISRFPL